MVIIIKKKEAIWCYVSFYLHRELVRGSFLVRLRLGFEPIAVVSQAQSFNHCARKP